MHLPSFKIRPAVAVVTGADNAVELAQARARVRALEATDDDLEQERLKAYLVALDEERRGVEQKLSHALSLGNERERILDSTSPTGHRLAEQTGAERALVLDSQLGAIDKEAARVRKLVR
jgi:hypothetical protein